MTLAVINVGSAPNDGTGDQWRNAWIKCKTNFDQMFNGPMVAGPPASSAINLTLDQGTFQQNSIPGLWIKSTAGFGAGISIGGNAAVPGGGSTFDFQQASNGNGFIVVRANASLNFWTNNTPRVSISSIGNVSIAAPTSDVTALTINGNSVSGVTGAMKALSTSSPRIATFDCTQGTGGYIAIERSGSDGGFFGNSAYLATGGFLDAYCLRSNSGLDFSAGGPKVRLRINSAGNVTMPVIDSGISFAVDQGGLDTDTNPGIQTRANAGFGARISICANAATPSINSFDLAQVSTGDCYIINRSNHNMVFWTNNLPTMLLSNAQQAFFYGNVGVNGNTPPVQVTGFGSPVGAAVVNNYNITDAGGANSNTNKAVAQIIKDLKAFGLYGA